MSVTGTPVTAAAGTITAAAILTTVNSWLERSETDIDAEIQAVLTDISVRDNFLKASTTITAADSTASTSAPDYMKEPIALYISAGNYLTKITYDEYMEFIEDQSTVLEGEPEEYALLDDTFYWKDRPDTDYTVAIDYYKYHADSTTVEFDYRFRFAVYYGVAAAVASKYEMDQLYMKYNTLFENEISKLRLTLNEGPQFVKYNDI